MPKILIVEDDQNWEKTLRQNLGGLRGIIEACTNSKDALSQIDEALRKNTPYDAYILDTMFPKSPEALPAYESPLVLIDKMKERGIKGERIFMIGYTVPEFMQKAKDLGVKWFYYKEKERRLEGQKHYTQMRADLVTILR